MIGASEALQRLQDGNRRFVSGTRNHDTSAHASSAGDQEPFAIVLGCSDSRVPAEIVFDQGVGDLFVIRVAGNIVAPSQVGSVEFAAERFGTPLVVVLGHTGCGAIQAALEARGTPPGHLGSIVDRIRPAIEHVDPVDAVRANVSVSADHLRNGSKILEQLIGSGALRVVGAEYSIDTGIVDFFDVG